MVAAEVVFRGRCRCARRTVPSGCAVTKCARRLERDARPLVSVNFYSDREIFFLKTPKAHVEFVPPFWLATNMSLKGERFRVAVLFSSIELTSGRRKY